ncbi:GNAT family N-acetyltransferase [Halorarum halobium]|uniref:GNAT family N-acetyltransferase n=1 Tax=Halorarum halobium TaxID=3075121 RepID=UPI0028A848E9|nr:GNAT family N-acetyltransferase [Halobaculum sp. XH14]
MEGNTIRWYRADDRERYLDLHEDVLGERPRGEDWFEWKYESNPYVDHVPIVLAEHEGELVGARSFFALPMSVGRRRHAALQPCDTMVRRAHRRRGLFTRMTEEAIDRYEREEPAFFFNFPNEATLSGNRKLGWRVVGQDPRHYRIEDVGTLVASRTDNPGLRLAGAVSTPVVAGYNRLRQAMASRSSDVSVRRASGVPADALASIYRRRVPEAIHTVRDRPFYRWRFENPDWAYTTYVTEGDPDPVGMVVAVPRNGAGVSEGVTRVVDVVPLRGDERTEQVAALLDRVQSDNADSELFVAPSGVLDRTLLRRFGFRRDDRAPVSYLKQPRMHAVRSLSAWEIEGLDVTRPENWRMTFAELDTG